MLLLDRPLRTLAALAAFAFAPAALAGPPLICHPFTTGNGAPLLPWAEGTNHWHSPDRAYDRTSLVADTLNLLSVDAPILVRMENMRRATIYAEESPAMAAELLRAVFERTASKPADARAEALEWFDAGYLVETYRQLGLIYQHGMLPAHGRWTSLVPAELTKLDGYELVQKAAALAPESQAELDFASALMTRPPLTATHLRRAASSAAAGSVLAQNLVEYDVR
jgi:hypothetical protein